MITEPTRSAQLAFAGFSALAVLARVQYVVVPLAVLGAELLADRGNVFRSIRRVWLALCLLVVPPALLFGILGTDRVLGVYSKGNHGVHPGSLLRWVGREAMLLIYSSGWVIVPGAVVGLAFALWRSRSRAELAFAADDRAARRRTDARGGPDRGHRLAALPGALPLHARPTARDLVRPLGEARAAGAHPGRPALSRPAACSPHACRSPATRPRTTRTTRRRSGPCCASRDSPRWATAPSPSRWSPASCRCSPRSSRSARSRPRLRSSARSPPVARSLQAPRHSTRSRARTSARRCPQTCAGSITRSSDRVDLVAPPGLAEGTVVAADVLEHLGHASPARRQPADRPVPREAVRVAHDGRLLVDGQASRGRCSCRRTGRPCS